MKRSLALALALGALAGCRDAADVFVALDRPDERDVEPLRLTGSPRDDRSPAWNATSDSVYYSGYSEEFAPVAEATILALPIEGGIATPVLRNVQIGFAEQRWLITPATSPDGNRVAITLMAALRPRLPCDEPEVMICPDDRDSASIRLERARVHVRELAAVTELDEDPMLVMSYGDHGDTTQVQTGFPTFFTRFHPYQVAFNAGRVYPSRASWAPDSRRLATSDGLHVLIWDTETGVVDTVPGTDDGVAPAWSADGSRIAFSWTERTDSTTYTCALGFYVETRDGPVPAPQCWEHRLKYTMSAPRIVLVDPDGSDRVVVAPGIDPAWGPDGLLYFAAGDSISPLRRYDPADGSITIVDGTEGAREPAVSPDGSWIAFSRSRLLAGPRDIFVLRLD